MQMKWMKIALFCLGTAAVSAVAAQAQNAQPSSRPAQPAARASQVQPETDVAFTGFYAINKSSTGRGTTQTVDNSAGGMVNFRHISSPFIGFEGYYGYSSIHETFAPTPGACGFTCNNAPEKAPTKLSQAGIAWVITHQMGKMEPFAEGGITFMIFEPNNDVFNNNSVVRLGYTIGGGTDMAVSPRFGVRLQVRDIIYKQPNLVFGYAATGNFTNSVQPMGGVYFRF